ncbi:MAG: hypothetical protein IT371_09510 [Deltaproteobacteria bacterium]|nr:hypothetical protein [Deltaproteobacteria bacterium]
MKRYLTCLGAGLGLVLAACQGPTTPAGQAATASAQVPAEDMALFSATAATASLEKACKELDQVCADLGKGCAAKEAFCASQYEGGAGGGTKPAPTEVDVCAKLKTACEGSHSSCADETCQQKACSLYHDKCPGAGGGGGGGGSGQDAAASHPAADGGVPAASRDSGAPVPPKPDGGGGTGYSFACGATAKCTAGTEYCSVGLAAGCTGPAPDANGKCATNCKPTSCQKNGGGPVCVCSSYVCEPLPTGCSSCGCITLAAGCVCHDLGTGKALVKCVK